MVNKKSGEARIINNRIWKGRLYLFVFLFFIFATMNIWLGILFLILAPIGLIIINRILVNDRITNFTKEKDNAFIYSAFEKYNGGMFIEAISDYDKALEINPDNPSAYLFRSMAKLEVDDNAGAFEDAAKSIELSGKNISRNNILKGYKILGMAKFNLADYEGAISNFNIAIHNFSAACTEEEENIDDYIIYVQRGNCYRELGDNQNALNDYQKAISFNANCEEALSGTAVIASNFEDYGEAINYFNKAILINSKNPVSYLKRGISKQALGDIDGACEDWKIAAELGDEDAAKLIERFSQ